MQGYRIIKKAIKIIFDFFIEMNNDFGTFVPLGFFIITMFVICILGNLGI